MMTKKCLACGEKLSGRSDKKYCNQACRNDFHNDLKPKIGSLESILILSTRNNRRILSGLVGLGEVRWKKEELEYRGFDFSALTGIKQESEGNYVLSCYEYKLRSFGNRVEVVLEP